VEAAVLRCAGEVTHVFSHINMTVHVFQLEAVLTRAEWASFEATLDDGYQLVAKEALGEVGVSTLTRKVIEAADVKGKIDQFMPGGA
jgi:adenine-specific DNA glycosylase